MKRLPLVLAMFTAALFVLAPTAQATTGSYRDSATDSSPYDARGDIVYTGANYSASDSVMLAAKTANPVDPATDYNWIHGSTGLIWSIDTNGDGQEDYWAIVMNVGGVHANVWRTGGSSPVCTAATGFNANGVGVYVSFPGSCIGNPANFSISAASLYDTYDTGNGNQTYDAAPDSGYCCTVTPSDNSTTTTQPPTTTTTQPPTTTATQPPAVQPAGDPTQGGPAKSGYTMASTDGTVYAFGDAPFCGNSPGWNPTDTTDIELTPNGQGYWVLQSHGYVDFQWCGELNDAWRTYDHNEYFAERLQKGERAVSISATPDGVGYWVFTDRGRVLAFGSAPWLGDMSSVKLNGPVLGSVATPSGKGYYMVASDGGIFTFGDAIFHGSTGDLKLNKPVMAMAPRPDGSGYWLVASDGGIFAFDVPFYGSMGGTKLSRPVSGMVPGQNGYLMVAQDGGIFTFGDVAFHGSLGAHPPTSPVVAVALLG